MFKLTDADLQKSATTYKKQLLQLPVISAMATLQHMTGVPGLAGRLTVGTLSGDIELAPYNAKRVDDSEMDIIPRTLETFLGSVIKDFDPNTVAKTVYGEIFAQGKELTHADITRQVLVFLSAKLGNKLNMSIFSAKRNPSGTKTQDLFNGFDTIAASEIAAGKISTGEGNLFNFGSVIDSTNAVDALKSFYRQASDELRGEHTKMFIPRSIYDAYTDDYQATVGSVPYNKEFKKTFLEGSDDMCTLVPLSSKKGTEFIQLTTKANMMYGYGAGLADENITVEKHHPFVLNFVATMFFGAEYESIDKRRLLIGKLVTG